MKLPNNFSLSNLFFLFTVEGHNLFLRIEETQIFINFYQEYFKQRIFFQLKLISFNIQCQPQQTCAY